MWMNSWSFNCRGLDSLRALEFWTGNVLPFQGLVLPLCKQWVVYPRRSTVMPKERSSTRFNLGFLVEESIV